MYLASSREVTLPSPEIAIIPATPDHLRELATKLRVEDEHELLAFGFTPHKALWRSYKGSVLVKAGFIDGHLAAIWGVFGDFLGQVGQPWCMTSYEVKRISSLRFARIWSNEADEMLQHFSELRNVVEASYVEACRMLEISGFTLGEPKPFGKNGDLFRTFERYKCDHS